MNKNISTMIPDKEPVLIVKDGAYLVEAGRPDCFKPKQLAEYAQLGYRISTITIKKFRQTNWKWIYDKPKKQNNAQSRNDTQA